MKRLLLCGVFVMISAAVGIAEQGGKNLVLIAGPDSHGPGVHEYAQGMRLFAEALADVEGLQVHVVTGGWPQDESVLDAADAIVVYSNGLGGHPLLQNDARLAKIDSLVSDGAGIGVMHFALDVPGGRPQDTFKRWIGGYYETHFSVNPMWAASFEDFPEHPVANGLEPFSWHEEWYFSIRFHPDAGNIIPILVATPSDDVRDGPYVHPRGPYPHVQAAKGEPETLMWLFESPDGGRGFGFTGGHYHKGWELTSMQRSVLNAMLWLVGLEVPEQGAAVKKD